jgi:hypothetical protein
MNDLDWDRLARFLGIADLNSRVPEGARMRFELGSLPQQQGALAMVLAAAALIGLAFWLYKREGQAALWKKLTLASLRTLTIGLAFLVILEPRLAVDKEQTERANTIVLWDESLSMSLADRYLDEIRRKSVERAAGIDSGVSVLSRQDLAWKIVERAKLLPRLEEKNQVRLYAFADEAHLLAAEKLTLAEIKPKGPATDLAGAVRRALEEQGGRTVAAVVAITDGRTNKGEGPKAVAAELKDRGIPFYAIGVGDPTPPKNLELHELICVERAYKNDPVSIDARVNHHGYVGEKVEVEFWIAPADDPSRQTKLETKEVELEGEEITKSAKIMWKPTELGRFVITAKIPARDEELIKEDNQRSVPVAVIDEEMKVLVIAGSPTYEYRHLMNMLTREKSTRLSTFLQSADEGFVQIGKLEGIPRTKEQLKDYDVVCLMDPNPSGFDRELMENLKDFVEHLGGGLLFVAGEKYTTSFFRQDDLRSVLDLIPVVPDLDRAETDGKGPWTEQWPYKLTDEAEESAITRLDQDLGRSRQIWQKVPGSFWHYPITREKPGAAVLVRQADERSVGKEPPLVITHFFGPGRTMFDATDETWRWRAVAPKAYDRFWIQALRYLVEGKLLGGARRVELLSDKNEYSLGEPVRIRAKAKDQRLKPLEVPALVVQGKTQEGETFNVVLHAMEGRPGAYESMYLPEARGTFELSLRLPDFNADEKPATISFVVRLPDREFATPQLDEATLNEIAEATGGALVLLDAPAKIADPKKPPVTVQTLPDRIPDRTETLIVTGQPIPLWDNRTTLILAVTLLGIEWFFRKRLRMV